MRRIVGLARDELETRERVFDGLVVKSVRRSLRAATASVTELLTAATQLTVSETPAQPQVTVPPAALGVVTTVWSESVDAELFPYLVQTFVDAAADVYAAMPETIGVAPKITYDLAADYLSSASNRLKGVGDVVWNDVRAQLALGYAAGETIQQLATRVRDVAEISEPRALTIARTEVIPAANFGSLVQLQAAGFSDDECLKEWLATDDQRTRQAHRDADGQRVPLNQLFVVDGDHLRVPGDPAGRAENVINCRCSVAFVFDEDGDEDDNDGEPLVADAAFERKHPRQPDGRFGHKLSSLPSNIARSDYDRLVSVRAYGSDATEADEKWADALDWPDWVKKRAEGEGWLLTKHEWYRESLPGDLKNMPVEDLRERMAEHLRKTWAGKPIAVRVYHEDLVAILKDGRFKTQFESGKAGREATYAPAQRKDFEAALLGVSHDSDPAKRPVYGYVSIDPERPWLDKQLNKFGSIAVMLKNSVRARTTATVGDSLNEEMSVWPSPVDAPSWVSANPEIVRNSIRRFPTSLDDGRGRDTSHPEFRANEYVEAQIGGGVSVEDIAEVVFMSEPSMNVIEQLAELGIPWRHISDDVLVADASFEAKHPRQPDGRFGTKSPFTILSKTERGRSGDAPYAPGMFGRYGGAGVMMRHVGADGVARYMVVQRGGNNSAGSRWRWQLPGGARDELETAEQAAARETQEELGFTQEQLNALEPRGAHVVSLPVEGKNPWTYSSVVADAPQAFKPKIDYSELGAARWLTYDQLVEMRGRGRLIAPFAAQLEDIIAKFDGPLTASGWLVTDVVTCATSDDAPGYYELMTAAKKGKWTAADEAKVKRDDEGKFAKKAGTGAVSLLMQAQTAQTGDIVAVESFGSKRIRKSGSGYYVEKVNAQGKWFAISKKMSEKQLEDYVNAGTGVWKTPASSGPGITTPQVKKAAVPKAKNPSAAQPLHINTAVIYKKGGYADGAVIAERDEGGGYRKRLIWDKSLKKFALQIQTSEGQPWKFSTAYTKKAAYDKFSKETGWTKPSAAPTVTPASTAKTAAPKTLDEMTPKEFSAWFHNTYAIGGLSSGQSLWNALTVDEQLKIVSKANDAKNVGLPGPANIIATWAGVKPSAGTPQLGKPIKLNTVAIYKTKYADGAVVAEKQGDLPERIIWDAKKKKFIHQGQTPHGTWLKSKEYNKGEAYQKFSKQTGWTHPVAAPTTPKLPTAADVQIGYEVDDDDEPSLLETMLSNTSPAFLANWVKGLNSAYFEGQSHDDLEKIGNKVLELLNSGHLTHTQAVNIDAQLNAAQQKKKAKSVGIPDFENDSTDDVVAWYTSLTQDQFDALTASEQAEITNEALFYDDMAPLGLGQSFSEKIDDLIAGKGDSPGTETNYALESAILMMTQSEYGALSKAEKIKLYEDSKKLADPTGAIEGKMVSLITTHAINTLAPSASPAPTNDIEIDYDDVSGPNMMSSLTYKGVPIAWVKTLSDGSGAMVYIQEDDGSKGDFLGSVDFDENETVEDLIMNLDANGTLDLSAISGTSSSTSATPAVPASTFAPNASQWHVDVHGKIKPLNAVGVPKTGVVSFKQTTDAGMQKIQQQMKMSWTPAQEKSLARYVKPKIYQAINGILRDDKRRIKLFTDSELKKAVVDATNIQEAMAPLADSLVLHRGTGAQSFGFTTLNVSTDDLKNKLAVGSIIREKGFTSTSVTNPTSVPFDYAKKPVKVIINAPEGTPAVYVSSVTSEHENQNELLLGAGMSFRVDEVRSADAADKNSYGSYVEQVVVLTVVPSNASTPLASVKPTPAVAPTTLAPAASSAVVAPMLGPIQASDLKKPIKINTATVYKVKYQHGAVVGYRKNPDDDSLMRLVWNANTKKFVTQSREFDGDPWTEAFSFGKGETYQKFGKGAGATNWYAAPPGDSAIGSGGPFGVTSVAPKVSPSAPAPSAVSAPAPAPAKPQPKVDAATIQAMHGQVPAAIDNDAQRALFDKFKKNTTSGFVTLSTGEPEIFTALHETLESHNAAATGGALGTPKLNLLQLLKIIDQQSTNKANAIAKSKGEAGDLTNAQLYEKKLIAWLQTPAGASFATDVVHPPPPAFVNGLEYKSKFSQQVLDTLAKIKPANSIGTPDPNVKVFKTVTASEAQELQKQMLSANPWSTSSKSSMTKYTGGYYATFNPIIRDLVTQTKYTSESTALTAAQDAVNIQNGMRPLPQSIRVFRKTGASQFPGLTDSATFADIKKFEGKLFKDRAPLSTSVTKGTWSGKVHLTIDLPEGTPAAFVKSISNHKNEDEMLLALGLNYRIISVTDSGGYEIKVHLRVEA